MSIEEDFSVLWYWQFDLFNTHVFNNVNYLSFTHLGLHLRSHFNNVILAKIMLCDDSFWSFLFARWNCGKLYWLTSMPKHLISRFSGGSHKYETHPEVKRWKMAAKNTFKKYFYSIIKKKIKLYLKLTVVQFNMSQIFELCFIM